MRVIVLKSNNYVNYALPSTVYGNYWIKDYDNNGNERNLINIEEHNDSWLVKENEEVEIIINDKKVERIYLSEYFFCYLKVKKTNEMLILNALPSCDNSYLLLKTDELKEISIGKSIASTINYKTELLGDIQAKMINNNGWKLENVAKNIPIYVNQKRVDAKELLSGDIIFIMGLKIIIVGRNMMINNPNNLVEFGNNLKIVNIPSIENYLAENDSDISVYEENDYYFRSPRFRNIIETEKVSVDAPPQSQIQEDQMPAILTMGSMFTMGMSSLISCYTAINNLATKNGNTGSTITSLILAFTMIIGMILFPTLSKKWTKKNLEKKEKKRQEKYSKYLNQKKIFIDQIIKKQKEIMIVNNISLEECQNIIVNRGRNLWERKLDDDDFLTLRVGVGSLKALIDVDIPDEHFSLNEDNLQEELNNLKNAPMEMDNVPISISLVEKRICAILGKKEISDAFLESLIIQAITYHSYEDLKIVFLTDNNAITNKISTLPHIWDDYKSIRFIGKNNDEINTISNYLVNIYNSRKFKEDEINEADYKLNRPYYLIVTDIYNKIKDMEIFNSVLSDKDNYGFSLLILEKRLNKIPDEAKTFINVDFSNSGIVDSVLVGNKQQAFQIEVNSNIDLEKLSNKLCSIPIEFASEKYKMPEIIPFLEMYNVGKVEQLNVLDRWQTSNPTKTLSVPIGFNKKGELFNLDIHEKKYGPHGLIAGMTGSGKSELIVTYIMSLAVNFHPYEIAFVLIDYKGRGLAGAFENKETGLTLPHLAGIISNIDSTEINRSLASIESELTRRQILFNKAREQLNESTMDIYKYQKYFKEGLITEPIPHLLIICDEFAELKMQQPEFMDKLISTARIGRSLGVHLILATQKPSGVVNDQIWSNARFRICLKVQDHNDSRDMIKTDDAASITNVGEFILQVGFNEYYSFGKSAWCGAKYYPTDVVKKEIDTNIDYVDNVGFVFKSVDKPKNMEIKADGEQLASILKYLCTIAKKENIKPFKLWLDRIPGIIFVDELKDKYNYSEKVNYLKPIIGEYDNPNNQCQELLTLDITGAGNTVIYGTVGAGKELVLWTIIYSLIKYHKSNEVNIYIVDYGEEKFKILEKSLHVGDIVLGGDSEKVTNLFKLIITFISDRKEKLSNINNSYSEYISTHTDMPQIIVMINNYDAFSEANPSLVELLQQLTREGQKYGIYFVITVSGLNSLRYRLEQNFKNQLILELNDKSDYMSKLGRIDMVIPAKSVGRGLIKINNNVYEFQTAHSYLLTNFKNDIAKLIIDINNTNHMKALKVPTLPKIVTKELFDNLSITYNSVPVGIKTDDLGIKYYDFYDSTINLILSQKFSNMANFLKSLLSMLDNKQVLNTYIFNANNIIKDKYKNLQISGDNLKDKLEKLNEYFNNLYIKYEKQNFGNIEQKNKITLFIMGIDELALKVGPDFSKIMENLMKKASSLNLINLVLCDTPENVKKFEYELWYKNNNRGSDNGIWIGNGINNQYMLKIAKISLALNEQIPDNFGYVVENGIHYKVKLLETDDKNITIDSLE